MQFSLTQHAANHRTHEQLKGNVRTHRVAGQRKDRGVFGAEPTETLGHARLHRDLCEFDCAHLRQSRFDGVVGAHTHSTTGDDEICANQLVLDRTHEPLLVVGNRTGAKGLGTGGLGCHREHHSIGVHNLTVSDCSSRFDELISGRNHHNPRTRAHLNFAATDGSEYGDLPGSDHITRRQHKVASDDVLTRASDVSAAINTTRNLNLVRAAVGPLYGHHRVCAVRHRRSSHDADSLARRIVQIAGRPLASSDLLLTLSDVSELRAAEDVLTRSKAELEVLVEERTAALVSANLALAEATRQAEQATRAQRRFVAAASHDLVQPLHAARLFLGNALVSADEADPATPLLRKADQSVEGAHRLLHALLNLSRLEIGALEPRPAAVDLGELLASLGEEFASQARARGLELVVMPTALWVRSDRDLLRSMLQNLMLNALRYTPHGRVVVCARRRQGGVAIEVRDTGVGIAADKLPRAFAEFSRLDEGQALAAGAGLGLAIVARIADALGHRLAVRSAPGRGSVFAVTVPATAPVRRQITPARIAADLGGLMVLCVDDERDVLVGTAALLERWGASVAAAASCEESLALDGAWDVVLADYHLGDGDGLTLLRTLAGRARVRLLVTATPEPGWSESLAGEGIECLTKPLAPLELQARLVAARSALLQDADERSRAIARS